MLIQQASQFILVFTPVCRNYPARKGCDLNSYNKSQRKEMAQSLYPKPSEESEPPKQSTNSAKSTRSPMGKGSNKRKAAADTTKVNFKKVCLCLEVSTMVAGLQVADLEAAKKFVAARLASKNPTEA